MPKKNPNPVDLHVGERIRERRALLKLSQTDLAKACGITFQQIQKYENGGNRVSASRLWEFSKIMNVSISYFFENFGAMGQKSGAMAMGMSDNEQEGFTMHEDVMSQKETMQLVREYYSIPDPQLRKDLFKMIKTMAASMREDK